MCQPALVATSVAAFRVAQAEAGLRPGLVMGHSLGEYSALVAAGAMGFAEALRIVAERGAAMRAAGRRHAGRDGRGARRSRDDDARALAEEAGEVWPANFNCPGQVVVSGTAAGDRPARRGRRASAGARTARLDVDGAFHSPLDGPGGRAPAARARRVGAGGPRPALPLHHHRRRGAARAPARGPARPAHLAGALRRRRWPGRARPRAPSASWRSGPAGCCPAWCGACAATPRWRRWASRPTSRPWRPPDAGRARHRREPRHRRRLRARPGRGTASTWAWATPPTPTAPRRRRRPWRRRAGARRRPRAPTSPTRRRRRGDGRGGRGGAGAARRRWC